MKIEARKNPPRMVVGRFYDLERSAEAKTYILSCFYGWLHNGAALFTGAVFEVAVEAFENWR